MDRTPIDFLHGDEPAFPDDDEDDGAEAELRQELEILIGEDEDDHDPSLFLTDEEVNAHWARQRVELYERMERLRRAAESEP